ncbi:DUF2975 domain-containing protein [Caenorhabditis elegans]|uniref:DUF2975 domain-containing protein n=1 Tax=Caenorhabditis elegans TaxID=6239 RepID=C7FZT7_CAEEL|nr:DUF2975 domain-containing protein [Caenorhabditis elegans]CBA11622.1 DUF2975 domain-containing protein [Caenorhabditis elegans]|eukprot:NP_001255007.1 Uncharacterized protein CELE_ZK1098.12 [Caenorhabditis elegans]
MLLNKLIVANIMISVTVLLQGTIPMGYVSGLASFWMLSAGSVFLVLAVITFIALLFLSRSKCMLAMSQRKLAIYHAPAPVTSLLSLIFFIVYTFSAKAPHEHTAIKNCIVLLDVGVGIVLMISLVQVLLAFLSHPEYPEEDNDER